jgi:hypothetical protein
MAHIRGAVLWKLIPALERIHQLARRLETSSHEHCLLAHHGKSIFKQTGLVFYRRRRRHYVVEGG